MLVAVGDSRLEDNTTTLAPPVGIAWVSSDGSHWQRVRCCDRMDAAGRPVFEKRQQECPQGALGTRPLSNDDPLAWYAA